MVAKTTLKTNTDSNIVVSQLKLEDIKSKNEELKEQKNISLPFYIKIDISKSFSPPLSSELSRNLKELTVGMDSPMSFSEVAKYAIAITSPGANPEFFTKRSFKNSYYSAEYKNKNQTEYSLNKQIDTEDLLLIDAPDMVSALESRSNVINSSSQQVTSIGISPDDLDEIDDLKEEITDLLEDKRIQNSYLDMIDGTAKFYETDIVFYKISKYL